MMTMATGSSQTGQPTDLFIRALRGQLAAQQAAAQQQPEWAAMDRLDAQRRQLVHTLRTGLESPRTWRAGADLLIATLPFAQRYGYWQAWREMAELAQNKAPLQAPDRAFYDTRLQLMMGHLLCHQDQLADAKEKLQAAQTAAAAAAHPELELRAALELAYVYERQGKLDEAVLQAQQAVALAVAHPDLPPVLQSDVRRQLGNVLKAQGDSDQANALLGQALEIAQENNLFMPLVRSLGDLGLALCVQNEYAAGIAHLQEAAQLLAKTQFALDLFHTQYLLGVMLMRNGQLKEAEDAFSRIDMPLLRERKMLPQLTSLLNGLGNVYLKQNKLSLAETHLQEAALYAGLNANDYVLAYIEETLSVVFEEQGQLPEAAAQLEQAIPRFARFEQDPDAQRLLEKSRQRYKALTGQE